MNIIKKITGTPRIFNGISWGITGLLVLIILGFAIWKVIPHPVSTVSGGNSSNSVNVKTVPTDYNINPNPQAIVRHIVLKTDLSQLVNYNVVEYTVQRGDALFSIAKKFNIKPETLMWANYDILKDSPDSLRVGQDLKIPPVDGVYYQWADGDTIDKIASEFTANPDDILGWPGNNIDLTSLEIKPGTYVMIPGGKREFVQWIVPTVARGSSGTANVGGTACGGGPIGNGYFTWPASNHYLTGNDYWSGHLGIDIAAGTGAAIVAADNGVVTIAQGGWNYGYGNLVMIDHGNGYITVYGHLSQINVSPCQGVSAGQLIGLSGSTGNSTGSHLHFEVRLNGGFVDPWYVLPPP